MWNAGIEVRRAVNCVLWTVGGTAAEAAFQARDRRDARSRREAEAERSMTSRLPPHFGPLHVDCFWSRTSSSFSGFFVLKILCSPSRLTETHLFWITHHLYYWRNNTHLKKMIQSRFVLPNGSSPGPRLTGTRARRGKKLRLKQMS